jgi:hypothetical protein
MNKTYDCLVCETGEYHRFAYRSDADKFSKQQTDNGLHVLRGISYV